MRTLFFGAFSALLVCFLCARSAFGYTTPKGQFYFAYTTYLNSQNIIDSGNIVEEGGLKSLEQYLYLEVGLNDVTSFGFKTGAQYYYLSNAADQLPYADTFDPVLAVDGIEFFIKRTFLERGPFMFTGTYGLGTQQFNQDRAMPFIYNTNGYFRSTTSILYAPQKYTPKDRALSVFPYVKLDATFRAFFYSETSQAEAELQVMIPIQAGASGVLLRVISSYMVDGRFLGTAAQESLVSTALQASYVHNFSEDFGIEIGVLKQIYSSPSFEKIGFVLSLIKRVPVQ